MNLAGATAIVTGASNGIGRSTAIALARAGAQLALGARRLDRLEALRSDLPGERHVVAHLDVMDPASCEAFVAQAAGALGGRIDILVNNAGLALGRAPVTESDEDDDRTMLETNVLGLMRMTKLVYPH